MHMWRIAGVVGRLVVRRGAALVDHGAEAVGLEYHWLVEAHLAAADAGRGAVEAAAAVAAAGAEARRQLRPPHGGALDQHGGGRGGAPAAGERDARACAGVGTGAAGVVVWRGVVACCAWGGGVVWVGVAVVGFFDDGVSAGGAVVVVVEGLGAGAHGG